MKKQTVLAPRTITQLWIVAAAVFLVAFLVRLFVLKTTGWGMSDDALISLRTARNLATGHGFAYNPGYHIQSSSSPLWTLISSFLWWGLGDKTLNVLPLFGVIADSLTAGGIALLAGANLLMDRSDTPLNPLTVWLGPTLCGVFYATISTTSLVAPIGLETGLYCLLTVAVFVLLSFRRSRWAAVFAALAMLLRPDGVLLGIVVVITTLLQDPRSSLKNLVIIAIVVTPYLFFALEYYGTLVPQSIVAKELVTRSAITEWNIFLNKFFWGSFRAWCAGICFIAGLIVITSKRRDLVVPMAWMLLYVAGFSTFAVWWPWYFPPAMIGYSIAVGLGITAIVSAIRVGPLVKTISGIATLIGLFLVLFYQTISLTKSTLGAQKVYRQRQAIAEWVDAHTSSEASIMLEPVGIVGYFSQRRFHDYPGLVSKEVTEALRELGRPVPGKPIDPSVVAHLLDRVQPTILILREDEFKANTEANSLNGYHLINTVPASPEETKMSPSFQTMFILGRKNDLRVHL